MPFTAIDHPAIACLDVDRLSKWYCAHLSMSVIADNGKTPPSLLLGYASSKTGGAAIELMPAREYGPRADTFLPNQPGLRHLALRVDDFDRAYKKLKSLGVHFLSDPIDTALGGGKIVSFRDPEGNELQIVERPAPKPHHH